MPIALAGRTRLFTLASATKTGNWRTPRRGDFRGRHRDGQRIAESAAHPSAFFWVCPWAMAVCATLTTNRRKPPKPSAWCSRSAITQEPHLSLIQPAASGCFRFKLLIKYTVSVLFLPWRRTRWVSRAIRRAPGNSACAGVVSWRSSRRILRRTRLTSRVSARVSEVGRGGARGGEGGISPTSDRAGNRLGSIPGTPLRLALAQPPRLLRFFVHGQSMPPCP